MGLPDSSVDNESACNVGEPGLIPGLGISAGEGIGLNLNLDSYVYLFWGETPMEMS